MNTRFRSISRRSFLMASTVIVAGQAISYGTKAAAEDSPVSGGTLNVAYALPATNLLTLTTTAGTDYQLSSKITEGLLTYDFGFVPKPGLATAWEVSADGKLVTFKIRKGVSWHDGKAFSASDVAFSIGLLKEVHPRGRLTFANVETISNPDDETVILNLKAPAPYLLTALSGEESPIVPKHIYEGTDAATNPHNSAPIGTGPFKFKEWVKGSHIIFEKNENYWDKPKPYLDRIVFREIPDRSALAAALETGEIHIAGGSPVPVPLADLERLKALPHLALESKGYEYLPDIVRIEFNLDHKFFGDVKVRQAIAHALKKEVLLNTAFYGYGEIATGPIPNNSPFYSADVPSYNFDITKAEKLLDEAGYPRGSDGVRYKVTLDPLPIPTLQAGADYIRQALGKIGINVTLRSQDFPTYIKRVFTDHDFEFIFAQSGASFDPTLGVQRFYWSKNIKKGVPFSNAAYYRSPEVDSLLEAAAVEPDVTKRKQLFARFQQVATTDLPSINILLPTLITIYNKKVINHTLGPDGVHASWSNVWLKP